MSTPSQIQAVRDLEARLRNTAVNFSAGNITAGEVRERLESMAKAAYLIVATHGANTRAREP